MVPVAYGSSHLWELCSLKFQLQFKQGFTNVVITRAGSLWEWSQGELWLKSVCESLSKLQWARKVFQQRHLAVEFDIWVSLKHFTPFPLTQSWFLYFSDSTDPAPTQHWIGRWGGGGGIRKLMLDSNKIEQALQYRKVSFSKSLSTTSVIHCSSCKMVKILVQIMDNVQNVTSIFQTVFQLFSSLYPGTTQSLTIYI